MNSGHQVELLAPGQHRLLVGVADEPLVGGDDLERPVAVLPELDRVGDGAGLARDVAGLGQQLDDAGLGLLDRLAGQLVVGGLGGDRVGRLPAGPAPGDGAEPAVALDDRADAEPELAPPGDVGGVAEGADHRDARALVGSASSWARIGTSTPNSGVVAVRPNSGWYRSSSGWATTATQAGSSSGRVVSIHRSSPSGPRNAQPVVGAGDLPVLQLGLGDGGPEVDVPEGGRLGPVGQAAVDQPEAARAGWPGWPPARWSGRCASQSTDRPMVDHRSK